VGARREYHQDRLQVRAGIAAKTPILTHGLHMTFGGTTFEKGKSSCESDL
jgi:hypothetical protein